MPLELQFATEADAERVAQIEREAYGPNEFSSVLFPGPFPEPAPGKTTRAEELAKTLREDPSTRWLKIVDTDLDPTEDNKQMIGFAQWNINDGSQPPPKPRVFGPGCNIEACEAVFTSIQKARLQYSEKKHVRKSAIISSVLLESHVFAHSSPTRPRYSLPCPSGKLKN